MKLEPGKYYRTRDGRKAFVGYKSQSEISHNFIGEIITPDFAGENVIRIIHWREDGGYWEAGEQPLDLVEEWKEPEVYEVTGKWLLNSMGGVCFINDEPYPMGLVGKRTKVRIEVKE